MPHILFLVLAGFLAGLIGGLLGLGGGILLMPVLRFGLGLPPPIAAGTCIVGVFCTTLVNDTLGTIRAEADRHGAELTLYGVTAAGICELFGIERVCYYAR